MRVLFDSSVTDFDRGGTSRYSAALLAALSRARAPVREVSMAAAWPWTAVLPYPARVLVHDLAWVPRGSVSLGRRLGATLYHGAGFKVPARAPFLTSVTIHDDTPWDAPPTARLYNRVYMRRQLQMAEPRLAGAITSAQGTADAILSRLPGLRGRLHVTPWGVDHETFRPRDTAEVRRAESALDVAPPYALVVGAYGPRKNAARILRALSVVRGRHPDLKVLMVGRHDPPSDDPLPVVRSGRIEDATLGALYCGAEMLVYTSLKEGFGMPVLEAMASGCPVVVSAGTVLQEVAGTAAMTADPLSVDDIARACLDLLDDPAGRRALAEQGLARAARFTWDETARLTLEAWGEMS